MTTLLEADGSVIWLVAVLVVLASGLAAALMAAIRANGTPIRVEHRSPKR